MNPENWRKGNYGLSVSWKDSNESEDSTLDSDGIQKTGIMRLFLPDSTTQEAVIVITGDNEGDGGDIAWMRPIAGLTDQETSNNSWLEMVNLIVWLDPGNSSGSFHSSAVSGVLPSVTSFYIQIYQKHN